jgi:PAS domain S-box-containing protein
MTLRERETLLNRILDIMPVGIWVADKDGKLLRSNAAGRKILGVDHIPQPEEYHLFKARRSPDGEEIKLEEWPLLKTLKDGHVILGEMLEIEALDGQSRSILNYVAPVINDAGMIDGAVLVHLDVSELKKAQDELKSYSENLETLVEARTKQLRAAQEKLVRQEKLAVLGQLAGGVGHELRNPLSVISNAVYFLNLVQPDADAKVKEYLDMIKKETQAAEKIITDLLDFARVKSVDRRWVKPADLVQRVLERYPAPENVEVAVNISPELPALYVDQRQMEQVLGNLVLNGYQAMRLPGEDDASAAGRLVIHAVQHDREMALTVQDSGAGIKPDDMEKLFEPLFSTKARGIGLGLTISRNLAAANGGRIEAVSRPGEGAAFTVFLPVQQVGGV